MPVINYNAHWVNLKIKKNGKLPILVGASITSIVLTMIICNDWFVIVTYFNKIKLFQTNMKKMSFSSIREQLLKRLL